MEAVMSIVHQHSVRLCLAAACMMIAGRALAQTPTSPLPNLSSLVGKDFEVIADKGTVFRGKLVRTSPAMLVLENDQQQTEIPVTGIRKVSRWESDSVWNGILIGAGVGAAAGAIVGAVPDTDEPMSLYTVPPGLLIGMAVGWIGDATHRKKILMFQATDSLTVSPVVRGGRRGLVVTFRF
jgi:hypothetical protein